jgi:hypothetical protein
VASKRRKSARNRDGSERSGVRRGASGARGTRKLPKDIDDLASGRRDVLRARRRPTGRLADSRVAGLIPGVANHEARRVFDARVERMEAAARGGEDGREALSLALCEAVRLGLWRARQLTGFEALAADVLQLDPAEARQLAVAAGEARGWPMERLPDTAVALWLRGEAALLERCPEGRLDANVVDDELVLRVVLPLSPAGLAAEALGAIGRKAAGLSRAVDEERERRRAERERKDDD